MKPPVPNPVVLVVDDDAVSLEVARERVERCGYQAEVRDTAIGTSQWILQYQPHVVLLDLEMPFLGGAELARIIQRAQLPTRIVLHSGKPQRELDQIARAMGVAGAISKEVGEELFARQLSRHVAAFGGRA